MEATKAMLAVPGLMLLVDTGHVAGFGEDPVELLPWATHIQLRQGRPGEPQSIDGDVNFRRVIDALRGLDYGGRVSIEYFDVPKWAGGSMTRSAVRSRSPARCGRCCGSANR